MTYVPFANRSEGNDRRGAPVIFEANSTGTWPGEAARAISQVDIAVTFLVTPEEVSMLTLGQSRGTLHLSLRNPNDNESLDTPPSLLHDMQSCTSMLAEIEFRPMARETAGKVRADAKQGDSAGGKRPAGVEPKRSRYYVLNVGYKLTLIHRSRS